MKPEPKNKQQVFDYVVTKLAEQGKLSLSTHGSCMYRGAEGTKCAVGWLIPDTEFDPKWDESPGDLLRARHSPRKLLEGKGHGLEFLQDLQSAHDSSGGRQTTSHWWLRFRNMALLHNLDPTLADKLFK